MLDSTAPWGVRDYIAIAAFLLVSFLVSNWIAWCIESSRRKRITAKTKILAQRSTLRTPVTIVSGFLGSGKTTLINHILTSPDHGKRIVIIENEVGAVAIDDQLLRADEAEKAAVGIFVMKNGCMCCSTGGGGGTQELERVLNHLLELREDAEYDYVLIETSGLADPSPVMQTFFSHQTAQGRFFLDGVVTLVDAKNVWRHLRPSSWGAPSPEVARQLAHATCVIVNKCDLLPPIPPPPAPPPEHTIEALEAEIATISHGATILRASPDRPVDIARLLDQRAFSGEGGTAAQHPGGAGEGGGGHLHSTGVGSVSMVEAGRAVVAEAFHEWAKDLVSGEGHSEIYRIKGLLAIEGSQRIYVFQGVCGELRGAFRREWGEDERRVSSLVVIGRHLKEGDIRSGFEGCLVGGRLGEGGKKKGVWSRRSQESRTNGA